MTKPVRVRLSRAKGWRMPPNTIVVARPTKWGNPYKIAPAIKDDYCSIPAINAATAVALHRQWLAGLLAGALGDSTREALLELRGCNLACWCALDAPCHADTLLEFANKDADGGMITVAWCNPDREVVP
jgi:hypothetical protein